MERIDGTIPQLSSRAFFFESDQRVGGAGEGPGQTLLSFLSGDSRGSGVVEPGAEG